MKTDELDTRMRPTRILAVVVVLACVGAAVFIYLASHAITVERADESEALRRFRAERAAFGDVPPMLTVDATGRIARQPSPPGDGASRRVERLRVLLYQVQQQRLVRSDIPFWFVTLKGPALQYALRDTGVDLDQLGITADDIRRHGPGPILDETRANGDRILVWVE